MKKMVVHRVLLILLLPVSVLLVNIASLSPSTVEKWYSEGFYKYVSQGISAIAAGLPFSLIEYVIYAFVVLAVILLIHSIVKLVKGTSHRGRLALKYILNVIAFVSIVYFIFVVTFDLNYQRYPFSKIADLDASPATVDELYNVCQSLANHASGLRTKVQEDRNGVMKLSESLPDVFRNASKGYAVAAKTYPVLGGTYSNAKPVLFSRVLTLMGFQGIHSPLTQEANINVEISPCMIPSTVCHEMAHQRGFAREDEANFFGWLTCSENPGIDFQYSGELLALIYSMNALYGADRDRFTEIYKTYDPGVVRDLNADSKFWRQFEGPVENISNTLNDSYLKYNKQPDGVKSYGRMVDLLIAEYRKFGPGAL